MDNTYIQFLFQSEIDLLSVQRREPWTFNNWFVAFQRWEDYPDINFLTTIDLWVQVRGIPLPYVTARTIRRIGNTLGEVVFLDFHEETTAQIAFIRVRIRFGITDRLRFFRRVHFQYGERAMICFHIEYGESSRFTQQNVSRTQKHKFQDADLGGFQKPPKKR